MLLRISEQCKRISTAESVGTTDQVFDLVIHGHPCKFFERFVLLDDSVDEP